MADWLTGNWGSLASALGLLVSIIGFSIAVYQTMRSRKAAEAAERAVIETKSILAKNDAIADINVASERIQELRRIFRRGDASSDRALDTVYNVRRMLSDISSQYPSLTQCDRISLLEAAETLGHIERRAHNQEYSDDDDDALIQIESIVHKLASDIKQSL